jgi:hypothetical protein
VPAPATANPFDNLYAATFALKPLAADGFVTVAKPAAKATGLSQPSFIDPQYGTWVYKATRTNDQSTAEFVRHEYSRRQAFNADNSLYLGVSSNGSWLLYDAKTFQVTPNSVSGLKGMGGDCEPFWDPTDPKKLIYTGRDGTGLVWWEKDVTAPATAADKVIADFRASVPALFPGGASSTNGINSVTTAGEGTPSADGRYFAFMARFVSNSSANPDKFYGVFVWDRVGNKVVAALPASATGNAKPDHVSMSPSGKYFVAAFDDPIGIRAYKRDLSPFGDGSPFKLLTRNGGHNDMAIGPNGEDYYIWLDTYNRQKQDDDWVNFNTAAVRAINIETAVKGFSYDNKGKPKTGADGKTIVTDGVENYANFENGSIIDLVSINPEAGSITGGHVSGKAFGKPGWVLITTYQDYGKDPVTRQEGIYPDPVVRAANRKVILAELKRGGRLLTVAGTRAADKYGYDKPGLGGDWLYFGEPQATISRDGSRVMFTSNFNDAGAPESYMVGVPSWAFPK